MPAEQSTVVSLLRPLCQAVAIAVREAAQEGTLKRITTSWSVTRADLHNGGRTQYVEKVDREAWDGAALVTIVATVRAQRTNQFEAATKALSEELGHDPPSIRGHLQDFLHTVGRHAADHGGEHELDGLLARFVDELAEGSLDWKGTIWLGNLQIGPDPIRIDDRLVLRPPQNSDFESWVPTESAHALSLASSSDDPDSVLEVEWESPSRPDHPVWRHVNSLCLFRVGAVFIKRTSYAQLALEWARWSDHSSRASTEAIPVLLGCY